MASHQALPLMELTRQRSIVPCDLRHVRPQAADMSRLLTSGFCSEASARADEDLAMGALLLLLPAFWAPGRMVILQTWLGALCQYSH